MILNRRNIIVLFILLPALALSQTFQSITGIVTDAKTGYPVENVNVFLAFTMMGAATDKDGYYSQHFKNYLFGSGAHRYGKL